MDRAWNFTMKGKLGVKRADEFLIDPEGRKLDRETSQHHYQSAMAEILYTSTTLFEFGHTVGRIIYDISIKSSNDMHGEAILSAARLLSIFGVLFKALDAVHDRQPDTIRKCRAPYLPR
jgi:hypothetical protein